MTFLNYTLHVHVGGVPDIDAAAKKILHDWNSYVLIYLLFFIAICHYSGAIKFFTHPPKEQTLPAHLSAEIVHEWSKAFDVVSKNNSNDFITFINAERC